MGCGASVPDGDAQGDGQALLGGVSQSELGFTKDALNSDPIDTGNNNNNSSTTSGTSNKEPKEKEKKEHASSSSSSSKHHESSSSSKSKKKEKKDKHPPPQQQKPKQAPPPPAPAPAPAPPPAQQPGKPFNRAKDRIDAIDASKTVDLGGVTVTYAYLSQRGFYPDDPFKANQDAYAVKHNLSKNKNDAFFGVFDGHGKDGDGCAIYTKRNLPTHVTNLLERCKTKKGYKPGELSREQIQAALLRAHVETNKGLHRNQNIDDTLAGTTAISAYFHGQRNRITISNVGDSRAVIGQETNQKPNNGPKRESARSLKAFPLSRDQTPYRKDERARVKQAGARVLSLDQLEGLEPIVEGGSENEDDNLELGEELDEGGDPPRVWAQNGDYPGTAFTRSIGDSVAEELGVFAEPEMLTREITPEDKIIVLASDGVFEFLTNQSVIDICCKFTDPLEACRAVVAEAYELWLQYELRTDDITMICIFIDEVKPTEQRRDSLTWSPARQMSAKFQKTKGQPSEEEDTVDNAILTTEGLRPVRKHASKETSRALAKQRELGKNTIRDQEDMDYDWRKHATEKTPEEKRSISNAIKASVMFRNCTDEQREMIFACMESVDVKKGAWVIKQGTVGDRFYIVDEGKFEVRIIPDGQEDETGHGGNVIHVYEGSRAMNAHPTFGELALVHSVPRTASVVARSDGHLWALHRAAFRQVLVQAQDHRKELKKVLGEIPYFQYLDSDAINKLATIMDEVTFGRGENITQQGTKGDSMYVISTGQCYGVQMLPNETKRITLKAGSYFGDEIFSSDDGAYNATVVSLQTTVCWTLDHEVMKQTMGPLLQQAGN